MTDCGGVRLVPSTLVCRLHTRTGKQPAANSVRAEIEVTCNFKASFGGP